MGIELAVRRDDSAAEARWLERALPLLPGTREHGRVAAAAGRSSTSTCWGTPPRPRASCARRSVSDRSLEEAETLLCELLEREGRVAELAAWFEESASLEEDAHRRAQLLLRAATLYREHAGRPEAAVIALLAARSALPDDLGLTRQAADLLHELGREEDAAEFDALLLEADPFQEPLYSRHRAYLTGRETPSRSPR